MEFALFGLNGLLLLAVWHFILKRTILDSHRDQLFDLRDKLRETFVAEGWDMHSPLYRRLRDLINGYLRFTESYSFGEFVFLEREVRSNHRLQAALKERMAKDFVVTQAEQAKFVAKLRNDAVSVMMSYMILSSGPLVILVLLAIPLSAIYLLCNVFVRAVRAGGVRVLGKAVQIQETAFTLVKFAVALFASKLLFEEFVEEYSYRIA